MSIKKKQLRLREYDYSLDGAYFVTICTQDKSNIFGKINNGEITLNPAGHEIIRTCRDLPQFCSGLEIDEFVVMPNHLHIIFILNQRDVVAGLRACRHDITTEESQTLNKTTLPDVVYQFKSWTTKIYSDGVKKMGWKPYPKKLWQRNYYERVVRDDAELNRIREYIINNPFNWDKDNENPETNQNG